MLDRRCVQHAFRWVLIASLGVAACVGVLATTAVAEATPLDGTRAAARSLAADVAELDASIDRAVLRYAAATKQLNEVQAAIRRNRHRQAVTEYKLALSRQALADRATLMYKNRGVTSLDAVLAVGDFDELVDQLYLLRQLRRHDSETVAAIVKASDELERRAARLSRDLRVARRLVAETTAERDSIQQKLAQRRALLADARARVRRLANEANRAAATETASVQPSQDEGGAGSWWPLIKRAAADNGVSASGMYRLMMIESGGCATMVGGGRYYGLYQYAPSTWRGSWNPYRKSSITDGAAQIRATALALRLGKGPVWWPNTYPWAFGDT